METFRIVLKSRLHQRKTVIARGIRNEQDAHCRAGELEDKMIEESGCEFRGTLAMDFYDVEKE